MISDRRKQALSFLTTSTLLLLVFFSPTKKANAFGKMTFPRSRNWFAFEEGVNVTSNTSRPPREYCAHCLYRNDGVCGSSPSYSYDNYLDSAGNPMPWISQETYIEKQEIIVKSILSTHKNGHIELRACADGPASTQECFDTAGNELTFVRDPLYDMPADPNNPERGYFAFGQRGGVKEFEMIFSLPEGIRGNKVMLQWKYITANNCIPPGYHEYFGGTNSQNKVLPANYWNSELDLCILPYPNDGAVGHGHPEQFFNCAEVSIIATAATPVPTIPAPPPVTNHPTSAPSGEHCCSWNMLECQNLFEPFCHDNQSNCEGPCNGYWIEPGNYDPENCISLHESCIHNQGGCCDGTICKGNEWYMECRP